MAAQGSATDHSAVGYLDWIGERGTAQEAYAAMVVQDDPAIDGAALADIAHYWCVLHGAYPGVIDHAANRCVDDDVRKWLRATTDGFAGERALLTQLTVRAGPIAGIDNDDRSDTAVIGHRRALELLAQSDRRGCALGAAIALALDWIAVRETLDTVARRLDMELRPSQLPPIDETLAVHAQMTAIPPVARAMEFGALQLLDQHVGLWRLLSARRSMRG